MNKSLEVLLEDCGEELEAIHRHQGFKNGQWQKKGWTVYRTNYQTKPANLMLAEGEVFSSLNHTIFSAPTLEEALEKLLKSLSVKKDE